MSSQRTLFQTWGAAAPRATGNLGDATNERTAGKRKPKSKINSRKTERIVNDLPMPPRNSLFVGTTHGGAPGLEMGSIGADDSDDDLMLVAVYEAEKSLVSVSATGEEECHVEHNSVSTTCLTELPGFDRSSGSIWIYPTNYPIRDYQLKMSEKALFHNTLVCLPTGLGKTFIASVIMYNFYRWYPAGKIVFMAPTKPLVAQQIEACYKVMGIPQAHMAELTGNIQAQARKELWKSRRVFFLTPQVMVNDLSRETCPAAQIKCVVIDEAHKALGNHAYCQVIRELGSKTQQFRVLALSATPGGDITAVQNVISNLLISHIELRSEESPDIQAHSHQRSLEKAVVPLGDMLSAYQARYLQVLEKFTGRLTMMGVLSQRDLRNLTKYQLILARDQFRKNPSPRIMGAQQGVLEGDFALCISLYHGYELLLQMGLRSLFLFVQGILDGTKEMARARNELQRSVEFMDLYKEMEALFVKPSAGPEEPFFYSHPKLQKLEEVVLQHFRTWADDAGPGEGSSSESGAKCASTRVMIFSSFRESVQEIAAMLSRHLPLIRVMTFMGQASAGKGVRGFTQREQLEVVRRFREGGFNTLVSTCVGEEGLDIGDVDLIVCFDAQKSPIRLVQRMGRTGRHRQGRIVVILAEGREERTYNQSQMNKRSVYKSIMGKKHSFHMFPHSPRMLPDGVNPTLHKMFITCGQFEHQETGRRSSKGRKSIAEVQQSFLARGNCEKIQEDGFLTPKEFSQWSSTLRLETDEPQPVLSNTHFLSIPNDDLDQEQESETQSRELSLWEWRYWQNRPFPTHQVNHSDRCQHFIQIMELIDSMRQENEGSCAHEAELMTFLHKEDIVSCRGAFLQDANTTSKKHGLTFASCKRKSSSIDDVDKDFVVPGGKASKFQTSIAAPELTWTSIKDKIPLEMDEGAQGDQSNSPIHQPYNTVPDVQFDLGLNSCIEISNDNEEEGVRSFDDPQSPDSCSLGEPCFLGAFSSDVGYSSLSEEPCPGLGSMFYLPQWDVGSQLQHLAGTQDKVRALLTNVKDFLSKPLLSDSNQGTVVVPEPKLNKEKAPPEPSEWGDEFQVNFCLKVDEEEKLSNSLSPEHTSEGLPIDFPTKMKSISGDSPTEPQSNAPSSPGWDEVFDDVEDAEGLPHKAATSAPKGLLPRPTFDKGPGPSVQSDSLLDESMDLFGDDDDDFLHVSMPDFIDNQAQKKNLEQGSVEVENTRMERNGTMNHSGLATAAAGPKYSGNTGKFDCSQELFSVNFDLGYCLEDSEEGEETGPGAEEEEALNHSAALCNNRTEGPCLAHHADILPPPACPRDHHQGRFQGASALPTSSGRVTGRSSSGDAGQPGQPTSQHCEATSECQAQRGEVFQVSAKPSPLWTKSSFGENGPMNPAAGLGCSDSEEELVVRGRGRRGNNPLASPMTKALSDVDSPLQVTRKRRAALITSEESESEQTSDQDFQDTSITRVPKATRPHELPTPYGRAKTVNRRAREFLDEEAELSVEGEPVSSDEEEEDEEHDHSLAGFVVDHTQLSQELNDSEMQGVYLKSVRSPALSTKYRMVYRHRHNMDVFSQVPEQDETYADDSFVVEGSEVEEQGSSEDERLGEVELFIEESVVGGRRMYPTRHRAQLRRARAVEEQRDFHRQSAEKSKRSRIIRLDDSSEEEEMETAVPSFNLRETPLGDREPEEVALEERCRQKLNAQASVTTQSQSARPQGSVVEEMETKKKESTGKVTPEESLVDRRKTRHCQTIPLNESNEKEMGWKEMGQDKILTLPCRTGLAASFGRPQGAPPSRLEETSLECGGLEEVSLEERCQQRHDPQVPGSDTVDLQMPIFMRLRPIQQQSGDDTPSLHQDRSQAGQCTVEGVSPGEPCVPRVLVDGSLSVTEVVSCLRAHASVKAQLCPITVCHFIVSNRMAVERLVQPESVTVGDGQNHQGLMDRIRSLLGLFDRVCLILEKQSIGKGDVSSPVRHSYHSGGVLSELIHAGVRLIFSGGPEETAAHLAELALAEQRKGQAIAVPTTVEAHQQQALNFYLTLPHVSYVTALNMSHRFRSVGHMVSCWIEALRSGASVSQSRAKDIFRFLQHICNASGQPEPTQ
ncbi:hypothetical protein GJAV_G00013740 [Gymnothorax javanicus]|nr:hypothetical protein GJAV_G00013740 [Gymnothorax javanicus]